MKTKQFTETLIDYIDGKVRKSDLSFKLILGGGAGPGGGEGLPWNSIIGQLIQKRVAFDITMSASPCMDPASGYWLASGSLLDNLNIIRYRQLPATWFETSPTDLRGLSVNVASGVWYDAENSYFIFAGGESPTFTLPTTNPRVDVVYVTSSGTIEIQQGTEAASPSITMPTASGVLPTWAVYLPPGASGIGYPCETYSGYLYQDLRPFMSYPPGGGGGGTGGVPNLTYGLVNVEGAANTFIRTDASIAIFDANNPTTVQCDDAAVPGAAAFAARRDHQHAIVCAAPASPSVDLAASAEGVATSFARSDHTHQLDESIAPTWTDRHLFQDLALNTAISYYVIEIDYIKTLGATNAADDMAGIYSVFQFDQVGGTIGDLYGAYIEAEIEDGSTGGAADIWGIYTYVDLDGGIAGQDVWGLQAKVYGHGTTVTDDIWGIDSWIDLDTGSLGGDVIGVSTWIAIAAGYTSPGSDVYGFYAYVDVDVAPAGTVYMLYLDEQDGIDYGIYQNGTALNYLGGHLGVSVAPATNKTIHAADTTIDTVDSYYGLYLDHIKTLGATGAGDGLYGIYSCFEFDQVGGTVGELYGAYIRSRLDNGGVTHDIWGIRSYVDLNAGTAGSYVWGIELEIDSAGTAVTGDIRGIYSYVDLNTGSIGRDVYGINSSIDIAAGYTTPGGDVFGFYAYMNVNSNPTGDVYMIYLDEIAGVDYGIYQNGAADNYFGGDVGIGTIPAYELDIADAADFTTQAIRTYSMNTGHVPRLFFMKSHHDTAGTLATTIDADELGSIRFYGVNLGGPAWAYGATIEAIQRDPAGGVFVETDLILETYSTTALNANQFVLDGGTGRSGFGTLTPADDIHLYRAGADAILRVETTGDAKYGGMFLVRESSGGVGKGGAAVVVKSDTGVTGAILDFLCGSNITLAAAPRMRIYAGGDVTKPSNSSFSVYMSVNQNNIAPGGDPVLQFDTEVFDVGTNFNTGTYRFVAPLTGKYLLTVHARCDNMDTDASYVRLRIVTSNRIYYSYVDPAAFTRDADYTTLTVTAVVDMDLGDQAYCTIRQQGGVAQMDVIGTIYSRFMGYLLG